VSEVLFVAGGFIALAVLLILAVCVEWDKEKER